MNARNSIFIQGIIHSNPIRTETNTGIEVTAFVLAHQYNKQSDRYFLFDVKGYGNSAVYADDFRKGDEVFIRGSLRTEYDKQIQIQRTSIIIHKIEAAHDFDSSEGESN